VTLGSAFIADASVVVKWIVDDEPRTDEAQALLQAHLDGTSRATVLDVTLYEVGNALAGKGIWGEALEAALDQVLAWDLGWLSLVDDSGVERVAAVLDAYDLSFYDASYLAAALLHDLPLVTDDRALFEAASSERVGVDLASVGVV
jgi:predicted nucleic acid-binding protein